MSLASIKNNSSTFTRDRLLTPENLEVYIRLARRVSSYSIVVVAECPTAQPSLPTFLGRRKP